MTELSIPALPRTYCSPNKTYIITGGLGGFGLELGQWLIDRGAKLLLLTSRSGVRTGYQSRRLRLWKEAGVKVTVVTNDVADVNQVEVLVAKASKEAPIGGIFHLAMVRGLLSPLYEIIPTASATSDSY